MLFRSLEDTARKYSSSLRLLVQASKGENMRSKLSHRKIEKCFIDFLNEYEVAVYRLRDAGICVNFNFSENGNYKGNVSIQSYLKRLRVL